jgi:hypothetical protein
MKARAVALIAPALGLALLLASQCTEARYDLRDPARDAAISGHDAGHPPADAARPVPKPDSGSLAIDAGAPAAMRCGKHVCACDDGLDNDGDGLPDGLDPECTAAFDDDEASFATGLNNKQNGCRDCFWDSNSGNGDDGCRYPSECLTGAAPSGNGNCGSCDVSAECVSSCRPRTPNGCDCFGCCEVVRPSGEHVFIELRDECSLARLDDLTSCPRCVPSSACQNPCGRCELCLGKTADMLPADCKRDAGPAYTCDDGFSSCDKTADCRISEYCQLGCCLVDLL